MTITFSMRNVTSELVQTVMIRKFFQMVFIGKDKKSLHIYTATVLGASKNLPDEQVDGKKGEAERAADSFLSDLGALKQFRMRFEFAVGSSDNNDVNSIDHEDLTSGSEYSFLNEVECIRNVWGEACEVIINNQSKLQEKYRIVCPDSEARGPSARNQEENEQNIENDKQKRSKKEEVIRKTAELSSKRVLWTEQKKGGLDQRFFRSLSIAGEFENVTEPQEKKARDGIAKREAYAIGVPNGSSLPEGVELVNWVRTTIQFKYSFDDTDINYIIKKEPDNCIFLAPDFTWYFSPVIKSFIDNRNCSVEVKRGGTGSSEVCQCPILPKKRTFYRNDKFQNSINPVPNKLTVNFHYWTEEEKISIRQKYRLSARDIFPRPEDFNEASEISIFLDTSDEHNRGNRQFLAGIFLSIALAFGIDSARLTEISYCFFPMNLIMPVDVWWIAFLVLFSLTLINKPVKLSERSRKLMVARRVVLSVSSLWVLTVFGVLRAPWLSEWVILNKQTVGFAAGGMLALIYFIHILYLRNKNVNVSGSLWANLLGEDIL